MQPVKGPVFLKGKPSTTKSDVLMKNHNVMFKTKVVRSFSNLSYLSLHSDMHVRELFENPDMGNMWRETAAFLSSPLVGLV